QSLPPPVKPAHKMSHNELSNILAHPLKGRNLQKSSSKKADQRMLLRETVGFPDSLVIGAFPRRLAALHRTVLA
ncbi:MAG: hypothetical protein AB1774_09930, partial [Bacillota bacterium]